MERFRPVTVGRYLGDYTTRFTCWSIADSQLANRTNGEKFDTYELAKQRADKLNIATVCFYCSQPYQTSDCEPYCSLQCSIQASGRA